MASLDYLQARALAAKNTIVHRTSDTPVAIRIRFTGKTGTPVVTMTKATKINVTDGTTSVDVDWATYTTVGAVVDRINSLSGWEAKVVDALRADSITATYFLSNTTISASTVDGQTVYDCLVDTSAALSVTARLSFSRLFDADDAKKSHRVHLQEIKYFANVNAATADSVQVWEVKDGVETKLVSYDSADGAPTTINWASGAGKITAKEGADLVVRVADATSVADSGLYLTLAGIIE